MVEPLASFDVDVLQGLVPGPGIGRGDFHHFGGLTSGYTNVYQL